MRTLSKSTVANIMVFMTDETDHISGKEGLTLTINASKNGSAFAAITPTVTDRSYGWYNLALTTSHTDTVGDFVLHIDSEGADPTDVLMQVSTLSTEEMSLMIKNMYIIQGLSDTPSTVDKVAMKWTAGDIELDLSGDGVLIQTIQRH